MPDAHAGKGSAVGTVIPTVEAVIPAAVGVDIGCGMIAARTCFTAAELAAREALRPLADLRESIEAAIPMSKGGYNRSVGRLTFTGPRLELLEREAHELDVDLSHSSNWRLQLGTLGGGNHFIELCVDAESRVWLFLHSGSRGVGNKIAQKHIKIAQTLCALWHVNLPNQDLAYLPQGTPEFARYLAELQWAQRFALENRAEMMDRFHQAFASWLGLDPADAVALEAERINTHHNYSTQEQHGGRTVWLTRKGAIDAHDGVLGIIPGSMGTRS
jgi:tRNA-splicing ligase RtcB (3'-phosphate/5'-hydroxy nucleic acid ligase)